MEKIAQIGLAGAMGIILFTVLLRFDPALFWEGIVGLFQWGHIPAEMPRFDFLAALAYGGVAGVLNLVQSEWVLAKGYGVAGLPAEERQRVEITSSESKRNFRQWFSMINKEHFLLFVLANVFTIFLLAYLGRLLLPLGSAQGFGVLVAEIAALNAAFPFLGTLFGLSGILLFIMANLTILDAIGRLTHRLLTPVRENGIRSFLGNIARLNERGISQLALLAGVGILLLSVVIPSFKQPFFLLVLSACLSAATMWLYPPLLLKLNLDLPPAARPHALRIFLVAAAALFYGFVTLWAIAPYLPNLLTVAIGVAVTAYHIKFLATKRLVGV